MKQYYTIIALLLCTQIFAKNITRQNISTSIIPETGCIEPAVLLPDFGDYKSTRVVPPGDDAFLFHKVTVSKNTNQRTIAKLLVTSVVVEFATPIVKKENSITNIDKPIKTFSVQIGAFLSQPTIRNVQQVKTVAFDNGLTKYFSGNFYTYEEAMKRRKEVVAKGYADAFIVVFENDKIEVSKYALTTK